MNSSFLIYCDSTSTRLHFVLQYLFNDILGGEVAITHIPPKSLQEGQVFINYSTQSINLPQVKIHPHSLLFEVSIAEQTIDVYKEKGVTCFFKTSDCQIDQTTFSFDLFALIFFLLTRYEEYLPFKKDIHGRFPAVESVAYKHGFLAQPVVDLWIKVLQKEIKKRFEHALFKSHEFSFQPTFDIDMAWAFLNKTFYRSAGAFSKALFSLQFKSLHQRTKVYLSLEKDPFFQFNYIIQSLQKYQYSGLFFILLGQHSAYDKNTDPRNKSFRKLLKNLALQNELGIHPSYGSNTNFEQLKKEKDQLSEIIHKEITSSRQHYLKLNFPATYRSLLAIGITDDYSMGYASQIGYRASTSRPFPWFDLSKNERTALTIHPFSWMDVTLKEYLKLSPTEATATIHNLFTKSKSNHFSEIGIWHNSSLSNIGGWEEWRKVYEEILLQGAQPYK